MKVVNNISAGFFLVILLSVLYFCYLIFKPFLGIIFIAAAFTVSFYPLYKKLLKRLKGRANMASALVCLGIMLIVIVPVLVFLFFLSKSSIEAFSTISNNASADIPQTVSEWVKSTTSQLDVRGIDVQKHFTNIVGGFNSFIVTNLVDFLKQTTELIVSIFLMLMTMFFLFKDGHLLLGRIMKLTPLADKYDKAIFEKFTEVSYSALVSTLVTGIVQGIVAGIAYAIVGVPFMLFSIATAFSSLIPFVGAALVWGPVALVLAIQAKWGAALFIVLWGGIVVSLVDNILRPLMMKGKTQIHSMVLFFAIFGGIGFFGFWGIIFGPLIISIALTLLHIYEMEYVCILEGNCDDKENKSNKLERSKKPSFKKNGKVGGDNRNKKGNNNKAGR